MKDTVPTATHLESLDGIAYVTDRQGVITAIGETNWTRFARENDASDLSAQSVLGRNLIDFVTGQEVRDQISAAMEHLAVDPRSRWVQPYRCDSPGRRRFMRQSITPIFFEQDCVGFVFQSIELWSEQRLPIELFDFRRMEQRAAEDPDLPLVTMCSWCQRVRFEPVTGARWMEAEDYYAAGGTSKVRLTHGVCEDCLGRLSID